MKIATNYSLRVIRLILFLLFIGFSSLYAQFKMGNTLAPLSGSLYPIIYSNDAKGGFHQVATITERNAIPALRRQPGMLCTVLDAGSGTPKTYQLIGGILDANWVEFSVLATSANFSTLTGLPTTLLGYGITDGMSTAHPANGISSTDITNWTTAFGWGNHAGLYRPLSYVPAWSEITSNPFSFNSVADGQLLKYNSGTSSWENWTPNYVTAATETDPLFTAWNKSTGINITSAQVSDFQTNVTNNAEVLANTAKISYPAADAAKLAGIAEGAEVNVNPDWNAVAGKSQILNKPTTVLGYGITDAMTTAHPANGIASADIANWNTAFGWGNHAGLYRPISYVPAWSEITSNPFSFNSVADGQLLKYNSGTSSWENWTPNYVTAATETDPLFAAWNKSTGISITGSQVSDFQTNVTNNTAVLANTAKITNANHTGDVTGSDALTITDKAVTLSKMNDIATARILGRNAAGTGSPEALDATTVKAMLNIADNVSFNIDRPITLSGNNNTGQNLGTGGKTMSQFFEAFFFPSVAATPPTNTFTTATTVFPYSTWKNWGNPPSSNVSFTWSVTNNSLTDNTDDKQITSIKLKSGATELANITPTGGNQGGTFSAIPFANTVLDAKTTFNKTYTLEVIDAQPNTVTSNITLTMSPAIQLTYGNPTLSPSTTVYEYDVNNKDITLNWAITPNDETVTAISVDGASAGTASTGSKTVTFKTIANGGTQTKAFPLIVNGSIYGAGISKNSPTVNWDNRLYRGTITSALVPSDGSFAFTDTQIKALASETKLGGNWKATAGYDFVCGAGGEYVCFAYPDDAATPAVQYYDSNFSSWMTYSASDVTVINRPNFSNQFSYTGTNYKLVFVNVQYFNATVKIRLQ